MMLQSQMQVAGSCLKLSWPAWETHTRRADFQDSPLPLSGRAVGSSSGSGAPQQRRG